MMEFLVDPDVNNEEAEIDTGLIFKKDHLSWLFGMINSIPEISEGINRSDTPQFCVTCTRYLIHGEDAISHRNQIVKGLHQIIQLVRSPAKTPSAVANYYISVQTLRELQVPIGDVLSHVLPHPHPHPRLSAGDSADRCLYLHAQNSMGAGKHMDIYSGRCAYRECEKVFFNRQSHLRLYGITPQFCSVSCKLSTWLLL